MLNTDIKKLLLAARPFQYLESQELDMLIAHSNIVVFPDHAALIQQGKRSDGMYIIIEGTALVIATTLGKETINLATLNHGDFIGEIGLIDKGPATASVIAKGHVQCMKITTAYFDVLTTFFPETKYKITKAITEEMGDRLIDLNHKIIAFMNHSNMIEKTIFSELIRTLAAPKPISFQEAKISIHQLYNVAFFKSFSKDECDELLKLTTLMQATKHCTLIKEGEKETPYFVILCGAAQASITQHNKVAKIAVMGPMSLFGGLAYIEGTSNIITYTTCEQAILLKLTASKLALLQKNHIQLWYKMFDLICKSYVSLDRSIAKLYIRLNSEFYNR